MELISQGICDFMVGNNGNFDNITQVVLTDLLKRCFNINISIVLSQITEKAISNYQELTVFPEALATVPRKFAIAKRNGYMLNRASVVVAYSSNKISCSYKLVDRAKRLGKTVINLAIQNG